LRDAEVEDDDVDDDDARWEVPWEAAVEADAEGGVPME